VCCTTYHARAWKHGATACLLTGGRSACRHHHRRHRPLHTRPADDRAPQQRWSEKDLRRDAFALAEARYAELEPALARLNQLEQEQADMEARAAEKKALKKGAGGGGGKDRARR
jgi:Domain of unknown function (DUF4110)